MTLSDFFAKEHGAQSRLAKAMQIAAPMLSQWASGGRPIPVERCAAIETATDRVVMRWDLRPNDWYLIWPELIGVEGAPSVPAIVAGEKPAVLPASAPKAKKPRETEKPVASGEERRVKTTRRLEQRRVNGERRDGNDPRTTGLKKPRGA